MATENTMLPGTQRPQTLGTGEDGSTDQESVDIASALGPQGTFESLADVDEEIREQLLTGAQFVNEPFVPRTAAAGGNITITGRVTFDNIPFTFLPVRIVANSPSFSERIVSVGEVEHGQTKTFGLDIPIPDQAGTTMAVTLEVQQEEQIGGWTTNDELTERIDIVTQTQASAQQFVAVIPWAAAGAGGGYLASTASGVGTQTAILGGATVGSVVGLGVQQPTLRTGWNRIVGGVGEAVETGAWTAAGAGLGFAGSAVTDTFSPGVGAVGGGALGFGASRLLQGGFPWLPVAATGFLLAGLGFTASGVGDFVPGA